MQGLYEQSRDNCDKLYFYYGKNECLPHFHKQVEILYINSGEATIRINEEVRVMTKNTIAMSDSFDVHSYRGGENYLSTVLILPFALLKNFFSYKKDKTLGVNFLESVADNKKILSLMRELKTSTDALQLSGLADTLLYLLLAKTGLTKKDNPHDDLIRELLVYIENNYSNEITLSSISKYFSYSPTHFSRLFNESLGVSLSEYINSVRVNKFIEQKSHSPNSKTTDIAFDVGFNSLPTFYRAFIKQTSVTPDKYWNKP